MKFNTHCVNTMAHQKHNIPWSALTSNLEWKTPNPWNNFATNLYPRMKPNQANDLSYFVDKFVKNLEDHAICERRKYQEKYDPPNSSDVILDENVIRKISPTVKRWREDWWTSCICPYEEFSDNNRYNRRHSCIDSECELVPKKERQLSAFLRTFDSYDHRDFVKNNAILFNLEIVKSLLLYGEIDALLGVCAHPGTHLKESFERLGCWECGVSSNFSLLQHSDICEFFYQ